MNGHIRQRGAGFEIRWRQGGKTRTRTVKGSRREAAAALRQALVAVDQGVATEPNRIAVSEWIAQRIALWHASGRLGANGAQQYREATRSYIEPHLGGIQLAKLTTRDVEAWHTELLTRGRRHGGGGISHRTLRNVHSILAQALQDAMRHQLIQRNVATSQPPPRAATKEIVILGAGEVDELLSKLDAEWHAPAIVALFTGLRRGELLALTWSSIDLDNRVLHVRAALEETRANGIRTKEPKTAAGVRGVALPTIVVDALQAHRRQQLELRMALGLGKPAADALVFPDPIAGGYQSPHNFSCRWGRAADRAGFGWASFHSLRHSHASLLLHHGVDLLSISRRLGHTSASFTLNTYGHRFAKDDRHAAEALDKALGQGAVK